MTKQELIQSIVDRAQITPNSAATAVFVTTAAIAKALAAGHDVKLSGFGVFKVKQTLARTGRNPKTGAAVQIPAGRKVTFKFTGEL